MQENEGRCVPNSPLSSPLAYSFLGRYFPCFVGSSGVQDDQVTAEKRTKTATSGGSRALQFYVLNCIERARKKRQ